MRANALKFQDQYADIRAILRPALPTADPFAPCGNRANLYRFGISAWYVGTDQDLINKCTGQLRVINQCSISAYTRTCEFRANFRPLCNRLHQSIQMPAFFLSRRPACGRNRGPGSASSGLLGVTFVSDVRTLVDHRINNAEFMCCIGRHKVVSVECFFNHLNRLPGVL